MPSRAETEKELKKAREDVRHFEQWEAATKKGAGSTWAWTHGEKGTFKSEHRAKLDQARAKVAELETVLAPGREYDAKMADLVKQRGAIWEAATRRALDPAELARLEQIDTSIGELRGQKSGPTNVVRDTFYRGLKSAAAQTERKRTQAVESSRKIANRDVMREAFGMPAFKKMGLLTEEYEKFPKPLDDPETQKMIAERRVDEEGYVLDSSGHKVPIGFRNAPAANFTLGPIRSDEFGMGESVSATIGPKTINMLNGMSPREVSMFYLSLNEQELIQFQRALVDAGYYVGAGGTATKPTFGYRDGATGDALAQLVVDWAQNPDKSVTDLLRNKRAETNALLKDKIAAQSGIGTDLGVRTEDIKITDATTLESMIDQVAEAMYGTTRVEPEVKQKIIALLQEQEKVVGMRDATSAYELEKRAMAEKTGSAGSSAELDAFVNALVGQESNGDPNALNTFAGNHIGLGQIAEDQWAEWATLAGQNPADFSAANQMKVIKYHAARYYQQFGNWRDVAFAWYGGGAAPDYIKTGYYSATAKQDGDYPSFNEYADSILGKMQSNMGANLANGAGSGLSFNVVEDLPDQRASIANELKALDPARYAGTEFEKQAKNFFTLIKGVI